MVSVVCLDIDPADVRACDLRLVSIQVQRTVFSSTYRYRLARHFHRPVRHQLSLLCNVRPQGCHGVHAEYQQHDAASYLCPIHALLILLETTMVLDFECLQRFHSICYHICRQCFHRVSHRGL